MGRGVPSGVVKPGVGERHLPTSFKAQSVGTRRALGQPQAGGEQIRPAAGPHCLLFGLGISRRPGLRLGLPNRINSLLPNSCPCKMTSTPHSTGGLIREQDVRRLRLEGSPRSHPSSRTVSLSGLQFEFQCGHSQAWN